MTGVDKVDIVHPGPTTTTTPTPAFPQVNNQKPHPRVRGRKAPGVDMSTFVHPGQQEGHHQ